MEEIVQKQKEFYRAGKTRPYAYRMNMLTRLEKALEQYEKELCQALYQDLHKSSYEAYMTEISQVKSELRYVKKHLKSWMRLRPVPPSLSQLPGKAYILTEGYGVVLILSPWNYPVLLNLDPLIDALAAGNCCVVKPSAYAPAVSKVLKKMLSSIYAPEYVCVVEGGREENQALLEQPFDKIFFTGSPVMGKVVMEKAARQLIPVTLELGGKSPCIVDESADLTKAARRILSGKLINSGQTCVAPDYVLVARKRKDALMKELKKGLERFYGGQPLSDPDYPAMINRKHYDRVKRLVENSLAEGAKAAVPLVWKEEQLQIGPVILEQVNFEMAVMKEEIFGPVLPILEFDHIKEVAEILQRREKPLALYLFSEDPKVRSFLLKSIPFGGGCVNDTLLHLSTSYMGFGGVGNSGMGSYHGKEGFRTFSHRKSILEKGAGPDIPMRYPPYTKGKERLLRFLLK